MGLPRKKPKKEVMPWRQNILDHHQERPTRAKRSEFPQHVVKEAIAEAGGKCQCCGERPDTSTHHVMPRSRGGRGVRTNAMRVCEICHSKFHDNEDELQYWIDRYTFKYGENFWFDAQDLEEHEQRQKHRTRLDEIKRAKAERYEPVVQILQLAAKRALKARELRVLYTLDENQTEVLAKIMHDVVENKSNVLPFGYGHFDD